VAGVPAHDALDAVLQAFELGEPEVVMARVLKGALLRKPIYMVRWLPSVAGWTVRNARAQRCRLQRDRDVVVVHGDIMTSVVGALLARPRAALCPRRGGSAVGRLKAPVP